MTSITRVVRLSFHTEKVEGFLKFFEENKHVIAGQPGCLSLQMKRDAQLDHVFFTVSEWESEDALNRYRQSDFFLEVWPQVKAWFNDKPVAYSLK